MPWKPQRQANHLICFVPQFPHQISSDTSLSPLFLPTFQGNNYLTFPGPLHITQQIKAGPAVRQILSKTNAIEDKVWPRLFCTFAPSPLLYIKAQIRLSIKKDQLHKTKFSTNLGCSDIFIYDIKGRMLLTEHAIPVYPHNWYVGKAPQRPATARRIYEARWDGLEKKGGGGR